MAGNIRRRKREDKYTQISNETLRNKNLSWKAKGLLCYLLSHDESFEIRKKNIHNDATDGYDSTNSAFKELEKNGYIKSIGTGRDDKGNFVGYDYEFDEKPVFLANKEGFEEENRLKSTFNPIGITRYGLPVTGYPLRITPNKEEQVITSNNKEEQIKKYSVGSSAKKQKKVFKKPTVEEVVEFFKSKGLNDVLAKRAYEHYDIADWKDAKGTPVVNWKQKMNTNWINNNIDKPMFKYVDKDLFSQNGDENKNWGSASDDRMVM